MLPLIAMMAIGLSGAGQAAIDRVRELGPVMLGLLVVGSLVVLINFVQYAGVLSDTPYEAARAAAQIVDGFDPPTSESRSWPTTVWARSASTFRHAACWPRTERA